MNSQLNIRKLGDLTSSTCRT